METTTLATSEILDTKADKSATAWNELLELQTDIFLPFELNYYFESNIWNGSRRILDIGCGNGYYLSKLHGFFPEKSFVGIDLSKELITIAKDTHEKHGLKFDCTDLFEFQPSRKFDMIIMRLILQHLVGFERVLECARKLLVPDGKLIIVEPDTKSFLNSPKTPGFESFLADIESFSRTRNGNRSNLIGLGKKLSALNGWKTSQDIRVSVPKLGPFSGKKFLKMLLLWVDIWEHSEALNINYDMVRKELLSWAQNESSFIKVGLQIIELQNTVRKQKNGRSELPFAPFSPATFTDLIK